MVNASSGHSVSRRWLSAATYPKTVKLPTGCRLAYAAAGLPGVLFPNAWTRKYFAELKGGLELTDLPPAA